MRKIGSGVVALMCWGTTLSAQAGPGEPIEIPLRMEAGQLVVTAQDPAGEDFDFVLGLGMTLITESGAARLGDRIGALTLGGVPVDTEMSQSVPDLYLAGQGDRAIGVLGGMTLNGYDILIDVPGDRLVLKPVGRAVRWPGISLSSPVPLQVFHDVLLRADVEIGGKLIGGLLDLANPGLEVNEALRFAIEDGRVDSFRMGYAGWPDLPIEVTESPVFQGWDPQGSGFAVIGAAVAYDCAIAISWVHAELRTCLR